MDLGVGGDATFSVIEINQFKHLKHVELRFRIGKDEDIKQVLAQNLKETQVLNS